MSHKLNTKEIGQLLDHAAARLDQETLDKLMAARRAALSRQQTAQQAPVLAWLSEHGVIHHGSSHSHKAFNWGIAALVAAVLFGSALYLQQSNEHDQTDIDIAILTDELPVDMYVD